MENVQILREYRNYTIMKYFNKVSKEELENNVFEEFPLTIKLLNIKEDLSKSIVLEKVENLFRLQLQMMGIYDVLEAYYNNDKNNDFGKAMDKFNEAFIYVDKIMLECEK